jgi:hypothetical protein
MNKEKLERELRYTKEKHKNDKLCTFATDISGMCHDVLDVLSRCIEIPDGATNGDMIMAMFPNAKANVFAKEVGVKGLDTYSVFTKKWWNAPYEGGKEE